MSQQPRQPATVTSRQICAALAALASSAWALAGLRWLVLAPVVLATAFLATIGLILYLAWVTDVKRRRASADLAFKTSCLRLKSGPNTRPPPFTFTSKAAWSAVQVRAGWEQSQDGGKADLAWASSELNEAIDSLLQLITRDFVLRWYKRLSDSPAFPSAVDTVLRHVLDQVAQRVSSVDWTELVVARILPIVTTHAERFRTAEHAIRGQQLRNRLTESSELDLFLANRYAAETEQKTLHESVNIASPNSKPAEEAWLRSFTARLLPLLLPAHECNSPIVATLVQEIAACTVLSNIVEAVSDPDFWNRIIDQKAGTAIRDKRMVEQFREALNRQGAALSQLPLSLINYRTASSRQPHSTEISAMSDPRELDAWIRDVRKVKTLAEARRLRSDVTTRIRRTRLRVGEHGPEDVVDGVKVKVWLGFVEKLYTARQMVEKRIRELGGEDISRNTFVDGFSKSKVIGLRDVLSAPGPLSYFMEFQDRRQRSILLQFWLLVEGTKDPLDLGDSTKPATLQDGFDSDVRTIWDAYLSSNVIQVDPQYIDAIREYLDLVDRGENVSHLSARLRKYIFAAQQDVFSELEGTDFEAFKRSDLYLRAVAELPTAVDGVTEESRTSPFFQASEVMSPSPSRPLQVQRTDTAPPRLSLKPVFKEIRPPGQRTASDGQLTTDAILRKTSGGSLDSMSSSIASLPDRGRRPTLSDSLDFLMSSPDVKDPLFQDVDEPYPTYRAEGPVLGDQEAVQIHTFEAIQEALSTILAMEDTRADEAEDQSKFSKPQSVHNAYMPRTTRPDKPSFNDDVDSSGLLSNNPSESGLIRKSMFEEEVFADEEEPEDIASEVDSAFDLRTIRLAAPGDLDLPDEIRRLSREIERLTQQEAVVGAMARKAELTGNVKELKVLVKSRESLRREIRALSFQRAQYESQETENKLTPGRTRVTISGTTLGQTNNQTFQLYLVEVHQLQADGTFGSGWIVTRRYSEFATLHTKLKDKFVTVRALDFPSKKLVTSYSKDFVEARRRGLERYLQKLVLDSAICSSQELRAFLSQQNITLPNFDDSAKQSINLFPGQSLMRSLYRTLTSGVDDIIGVNATSIVDTVISRLSYQTGVADLPDEDLVAQVIGSKSLADELNSGQEGLSHFTAPICDFFITLFQLKDKNQWLRRQAILIILQQVLGGTIERKFREAVKLLTSQAQLAQYVESLKASMWPGGQPKERELPRTFDQKAATKDAAFRKLMALMPASFIGRSNAKHGTRQLFALIQNQRLNKHLIYTILEEVVSEMFPEIRLGAK
ncbi:tRNA (guanine-N(7)-)-methyltransferase (tRNA(m7G46)-methyltransferase) [Microbotryomycetes sp. JL201]|nr:tRNA (guanine-N(7)-)-methyltransferase (tRNA(m7G46)-methyltransferase) [Microbotryomycetes sp. JL201]